MIQDPNPRFLAPRDWAAHPPHIAPFYTSTRLRGPTQPLVPLQQSLAQLTAPVYGHDQLGPLDHDLTRNALKNGQPIG